MWEEKSQLKNPRCLRMLRPALPSWNEDVATKSAEQQSTDAQQSAQIADLQQEQPVYQQPAPPPPVYQQPAPPPPEAAAPAPSGATTDDKLAQLKQLGELRESGVLTDAEFEATKLKILGSF